MLNSFVFSPAEELSSCVAWRENSPSLSAFGSVYFDAAPERVEPDALGLERHAGRRPDGHSIGQWIEELTWQVVPLDLST